MCCTIPFVSKISNLQEPIPTTSTFALLAAVTYLIPLFSIVKEINFDASLHICEVAPESMIQILESVESKPTMKLQLLDFILSIAILELCCCGCLDGLEILQSLAK